MMAHVKNKFELNQNFFLADEILQATVVRFVKLWVTCLQANKMRCTFFFCVCVCAKDKKNPEASLFCVFSSVKFIIVTPIRHNVFTTDR